MCHRKTLLDDMQSISDQMLSNRQQSISEVVSFIDKQAKDGHEQAKKLIDNAIDRIIKSSENIYTYIENRRSAKVIHSKKNLFSKRKNSSSILA
jgi:glutamyl-tRNA reductase